METAPALQSGAGAVHPHGSSAGQMDEQPLVTPTNAGTARRVTPPNEGQPAPGPYVRRAGRGPGLRATMETYRGW